jgi:phosphatidylserine/phosphatidylglycerophosphate/cardiolipin synthase-like enzyme
MRSLLLSFSILLSCFSFSQTIQVLFTQSVDNSVSPITNANKAVDIEDTIVSRINLANTTLDIAVWDNGSANIIGAINAAYTRGVQVRYISSSNSLNSAMSGLNAAIPVLERQSLTNTMHNKFVIVDNSILMTGSMNFGLGSMFDDYNNFIIINNSSLALNYLTEFNEMWGGSGAQPNTTLSKFGADKADNTIHNFTIATIPVESYFSPSDGTTAKIINAINSANHTLEFATFTFNNNDIGDAVIAAKNRGVIVRGIIENVNYIGSEYSGLVSNGVNVLSHLNVPYDFHHKYGIVDAGYPASDPLVIMGSHNWTNSAENDYDENTLIIHDNVIASQYLEEFTERFNEFSVGVKSVTTSNQFNCYPNPLKNQLNIETGDLNEYTFSLISSLGNTVMKSEMCKGNVSLNLELENGIYFLQINSLTGKTTKKIIVAH